MVVCTGYLKNRLYLNKHFVILNFAARKRNHQPVFALGIFLPPMLPMHTPRPGMVR
ncbi:Uncharacterised protein [Helicobacter pametensis]|nr:Uncharacterised protein [Helicobacter pametensis]